MSLPYRDTYTLEYLAAIPTYGSGGKTRARSYSIVRERPRYAHSVQKERQPQITFKELTKDGMIACEFITSKAKAISMQVDANTTATEMAQNLLDKKHLDEHHRDIFIEMCDKVLKTAHAQQTEQPTERRSSDSSEAADTDTKTLDHDETPVNEKAKSQIPVSKVAAVPKPKEDEPPTPAKDQNASSRFTVVPGTEKDQKDPNYASIPAQSSLTSLNSEQQWSQQLQLQQLQIQQQQREQQIQQQQQREQQQREQQQREQQQREQQQREQQQREQQQREQQIQQQQIQQQQIQQQQRDQSQTRQHYSHSVSSQASYVDKQDFDQQSTKSEHDSTGTNTPRARTSPPPQSISSTPAPQIISVKDPTGQFKITKIIEGDDKSVPSQQYLPQDMVYMLAQGHHQMSTPGHHQMTSGHQMPGQYFSGYHQYPYHGMPQHGMIPGHYQPIAGPGSTGGQYPVQQIMTPYHDQYLIQYTRLPGYQQQTDPYQSGPFRQGYHPPTSHVPHSYQMTATTAPPPQQTTATERCSLASLQTVASDTSSDSPSPNTAAPPSRFIIKPVEETKHHAPDTANSSTDKKFNVKPVQEDNKDQKMPQQSSEAHILPVSNSRDNIRSESSYVPDHNTEIDSNKSHNSYISNVNNSMSDIRFYPEWLRADKEYQSLANKHEKELDDMKVRHDTEKRNLYEKKIHINHNNMAMTRDRSTSNSDLMNSLGPQILSASSLETDSKQSIDSHHPSVELLHRQSIPDMKDMNTVVSNNTLVYPIMMPPQHYSGMPPTMPHMGTPHGHTWTNPAQNSQHPPLPARWSHSQQAPHGMQPLYIMPQSGMMPQQYITNSHSQSAMAVPQGYKMIRPEDLNNLHN